MAAMKQAQAMAQAMAAQQVMAQQVAAMHAVAPTVAYDLELGKEDHRRSRSVRLPASSVGSQEIIDIDGQT